MSIKSIFVIIAFYLCNKSVYCIPSYNLDTIIPTNSIGQNELDIFRIGTQWTFESEDYFGGGHGKIGYGTITIIDTSNTKGKKIYYLNNKDSLYVENDQMFFWDEELKSYEMHFDFNSTTGYEIKYWDWSRQSIQIAQVKVDSIYNTIINSDTILTQLLRISNSGSFDPFIIPVYKNIGASEHAIKLYLGFGLWDPNPIVTKLRCFKSDSTEYNFQNYPCDSSWLVSGLNNVQPKDLKIYPNPTHETLKIDWPGSDLSYTLYNVHGQQLAKGTVENGEIAIPYLGVFVIKFKLKEKYVFKKIIRQE